MKKSRPPIPLAPGTALVVPESHTLPALALGPLVALAHDQPLLDPDALSETTAASVAELLHQGQSANTLASYATALRYWAAWYAARYGTRLVLPVPVPVVVQFIADHAARAAPSPASASAPVDGDAGGDAGGREGEAAESLAGPPVSDATSGPPRGRRDAQRAPAPTVHDLPPEIDALLVAQGYKGKLGAFALNTLQHRVAVLSKAHQLRDMDNPCNHPGVRELLTQVRRGHAERGARTKKQAALTREPLDAMLQTCDDTPRGLRDRALLYFAWASGGRRRSEVAGATVDHLVDLGAEGFLYVLERSKGNQEGVMDGTNHKPVVGKAAQALRQWLAAGRITEGPIFRRILRGGKVTAEGLDPESVRRLVQARSKLAGLTGHFSAHSLRSGFVTEAGRRGMPTEEAMKLTGHKKIETFMGYYQLGNAIKSKAARMLEDDDVENA